MTTFDADTAEWTRSIKPDGTPGDWEFATQGDRIAVRDATRPDDPAGLTVLPISMMLADDPFSQGEVRGV